MLCFCRNEFDSLRKMNRHRRDCPAYREALFAEIDRISIALHGHKAAITQKQWHHLARSEVYVQVPTLIGWYLTWNRLMETYAQSRGLPDAHPPAKHLQSRPGRQSFEIPPMPELDRLLEPGRFTNPDVPIENCYRFLLAVVGRKEARRLAERSLS
jgi:hypothetical protein